MLSGLAALSVPPCASPLTCGPLSGGFESFPSTAVLIVDVDGLGEPFVVRLSSATSPDGVLQRAGQVGSSAAFELLSLELAGYHPDLGAVTLHESGAHPSSGALTEIVQDGSCKLASAAAALELYVEIDVASSGETWIHSAPIEIRGPVDGLPLSATRLEVPFVEPVVLTDEATGQHRGELLYARLDLDPPFPAPGGDCADSLLTAHLELLNPSQTVELVGFGPTEVLHGPTIPGGTCVLSPATPCDDDDDCAGLDICRRPHIDTELFQFDLGGFDIVLGSWQLKVLPELGDSNCCTAHSGTGCTDPTCQALVCDIDSFCCRQAWDALCADLAESEAECSSNCLDPEAHPSLGSVTSVDLGRTYPAKSQFDVFLRLDTSQKGSLHNAAPIPLKPGSPISNLPPDPGTSFVYTGAPISMLNPSGSVAGKLSNIVQTLDAPHACTPPPGAGEDCFTARLELELDPPGCGPQSVVLTGPLRLVRDDPAPGAGFGQVAIDALVAELDLSGNSACLGPLTARLAHAAVSPGEVHSLAPEEPFPGDSSLEVALDLVATSGTLHSGPLHVTTTVEAVPFPEGETYFLTGPPVPLTNGGGQPVGEILGAELEITGSGPCASGSGSVIRFTGPSHAPFDVQPQSAGSGEVYDVVRGNLQALVAGHGDFSSAVCLVVDGPPTQSDSGKPSSGQGFFYVARDGFGAFDGSWNEGGVGQVGDRDASLPDCQ